MIESSFCFLSGVGRRTERQWWQFRPRGFLNMLSLVTAPHISYGGWFLPSWLSGDRSVDILV